MVADYWRFDSLIFGCAQIPGYAWYAHWDWLGWKPSGFLKVNAYKRENLAVLLLMMIKQYTYTQKPQNWTWKPSIPIVGLPLYFLFPKPIILRGKWALVFGQWITCALSEYTCLFDSHLSTRSCELTDSSTWTTFFSEKKSTLKHMGFRGSGLHIGRECFFFELAQPLVFQIPPVKVWCL